MKYKVKVRVREKPGANYQQRTFIAESAKMPEEYCNEVIGEYDMFPCVRVIVKVVSGEMLPWKSWEVRKRN